MLMVPFGEVLYALENARLAAWNDGQNINKLPCHRNNISQHGILLNSHSQPIYVPGKYLVCLFN